MNVTSLAKQGLLAAIYASSTIWLGPLSYGAIQLRLSEVLIIFVLFERKNWIGLTLGCIIANIFSPLGFVDVVFGAGATFLACMLMIKSKTWKVGLLFPALVNGLVIGLELFFIYKMPLLLSMVTVFIGEFIVTYIPGIIMYTRLKKSKKFMDIFQ